MFSHDRPFSSDAALKAQAMSVDIFGMQPVSLPRFAAAHNAPVQTAAINHPGRSGLPNEAAAAPGDGLDFDLLAEYLLDEGGTAGPAAGMPQFDFSVDSPPASGVVSPEQQSEDGLQHAMTESAPVASAPVALQQPAIPQAGALQAPIAQAPAFLQPGMPLPPAPTASPFPTLHAAVPTTVPAPIAAAPAVMISQQTAPALDGVPGNKRRRVEQAMLPVPTAAPAAIMNGNLMAHTIPGRGRQKTQAQIDRRRERNRILARRTRLRKKFFFESLQKEVTDLQRENTILKELVRKKLDPEKSKELLEGCKAIENLPSAVTEACGENVEGMDQQDFNLVQSIQQSQQCFVITDPGLQDNPIVYASDDFLTLTGYKREEVLGRNCRFLQGTETSPEKVESVRKAIANGQDVSVTFINYTASGTAFWNKLFIAALRDAQNNIVNFIGVIVKVAAPDPEDPEANKRLPGQQQPVSTGADDELADVDSKADPSAVAKAADGTVRAIEGAVSAAVAAAPVVNGAS
eukprot:CAMPEP_0116848590 /NCGR_PEP_ID=MMETSP0418-20121206/15091_1 /TAXON_ID=1158023 /ORGANISM="Astrosyne radiata, Strain 13vi08-1A" /LENGTH=517 /DNA_ID=CAMNT_0004480197 /DNA_START=102 /DNA_END=1655 /DNA_ORIENTATION=-